METRKVVAILIAGLNEMTSNLEELMSEDGGEKEEKPKSRPSRSKRDEEEEEKDVDDEKGDDEEASESDIIKAVRGALKVLDKEDVTKVIKKHGKADKATEVKASLRKDVIDALEEAIADAD